MKSIAKSLITTSFAATIAGLTISCDSKPLETETDRILNTPDFPVVNRGINMTFASAPENAALTAELPTFFLKDDIITHTETPHLDERAISQLGEATINSGGQLQIDNIHLVWDRNSQDLTTGLFQLSVINRWPTFDDDRLELFETRINDVLQAAQGSPSALTNAMRGDRNSDTAPALAAAAASIGYLTSVDDAAFDALVLMDRFVEYTVTSTNDDLVNNGTISGTYTIVDVWASIARVRSDDQPNTGLTEFDSLSLVHNTPPIVITRTNDQGDGDFTIQLSNFTPAP